MDSEKRLRVYKSAATMARHAWNVDKSPGHTHRNQNACLKVLRLSMGKICACIHGLRCELVKDYLHPQTPTSIKSRIGHLEIFTNEILTHFLISQTFPIIFIKKKKGTLFIKFHLLEANPNILLYNLCRGLAEPKDAPFFTCTATRSRVITEQVEEESYHECRGYQTNKKTPVGQRSDEFKG